MKINFINSKLSIVVQSVYDEFLAQNNIELSLLRLDLVHPTISGNKWFKLKHNIAEAKLNGKKTMLSFGGAFSNHLHAMAYACKGNNLKSVGIIRGEQPKLLSNTLNDCLANEMHLHYVSREEYAQKSNLKYIEKLRDLFGDFYLVPEGGNNYLGVMGCAEIATYITKNYGIICLPVGTTTTMAGLVIGTQNHQQIIGFSALKGAEYLNVELNNLLQNFEIKNHNYSINHNYHFGGFAKHKPELIEFMKQFKTKQNVELDFIYTAKMMFGIYDLISNGGIKKNSCILAIHTGGLQGNRSLKNILD